jgi:hypothetical protein
MTLTFSGNFSRSVLLWTDWLYQLHNCKECTALVLKVLNSSNFLMKLHFTLGKVVPVLNWLRIIPWRCMWKWRYSCSIVDLGTIWRWVVSFMSQPLCSCGKSAQSALNRMLFGSQSQSGSCEVEKISCPCQQSNPSQKPIACYYTDWYIPAPHFT